MNEHQTWEEWREEANDVCALPLVQRLAALLDRDASTYRAGDILPQGWHMTLFTPTASQSTLKADGHPETHGQYAPAGFPRRMLGGRRTQFHGPLTIGADVRRISQVAEVKKKHGQSGEFTIVTVRHSTSQVGDDAPAIIEEQDIIYRKAAEPDRATAAPPLPPSQETERPFAAYRWNFTPDPTLLFRYSAITFNAHRIHYDQPYATGEEGYPGLIVNGGLTMLLLLEKVKEVAGRPLRSVDVRNRRPLVCGKAAWLCLTPSEPGWALWAENERGHVALEASVA